MKQDKHIGIGQQEQSPREVLERSDRRQQYPGVVGPEPKSIKPVERKKKMKDAAFGKCSDTLKWADRNSIGITEILPPSTYSREFVGAPLGRSATSGAGQ